MSQDHAVRISFKRNLIKHGKKHETTTLQQPAPRSGPRCISEPPWAPLQKNTVLSEKFHIQEWKVVSSLRKRRKVLRSWCPARWFDFLHVFIPRAAGWSFSQVGGDTPQSAGTPPRGRGEPKPEGRFYADWLCPLLEKENNLSEAAQFDCQSLWSLQRNRDSIEFCCYNRFISEPRRCRKTFLC